jgi:hypothetical protein
MCAVVCCDPLLCTPSWQLSIGKGQAKCPDKSCCTVQLVEPCSHTLPLSQHLVMLTTMFHSRLHKVCTLSLSQGRAVLC